MALAVDASLSTPPEPRLRRKIAAILAADVAGYSRLVAEAEEETLRQLAAAREIFDGLVARGGGRIFNTAGDSVMCEFDSAVEAVRVAIDIQQSLAARNAPVPQERRLEFRMGLTIGDVVERGTDLLGDGVNIAARLESLAPPGGICISRSVHEAVANKIAVTFEEIGPRQVKNLPQPIHAFVMPAPRVAPPEPEAAPAGPEDGEILSSAEPRVPRLEPRPARAGAGRRAGRIPLVMAGVAALAIAGWFGLGPARQALRATPPSNLAATSSDPAPSESVVPQPEKPAPAPAPAPGTKSAAPKTPSRTAEKPADPTASSREGVSPEPASLADLYREARSIESRGDRPEALRAYAALVARSAEFIDVDLRYAVLLRGGGMGLARQTFAELAKTSQARAASLAAATLAEPSQRTERLEAFLAANPDYAPAAYLLAEHYLSSRQTAATLTERRLAFDAFDTFLEASADPKTAAAFLDRSVLASWRETARKRRNEIEGSFLNGKTRPSASFSRSETGWTVSLTIPEPALSVSYRIGEQGAMHETGLGQNTDVRTGKPAPKTSFELPASQGRSTLYVTYTDETGYSAGPFPIQFDPVSALATAGREALERFPEAWVSFRPDIEDLLSYTQLVTNRCAISHALIGFGDDPPKEPLRLPPCNEHNPYAIPADARPVLRLPSGTDSVQVQLVFADGGESQVRTFRRP
jgi:class 3 adenylate cyclase